MVEKYIIEYGGMSVEEFWEEQQATDNFTARGHADMMMDVMDRPFQFHLESSSKVLQELRPWKVDEEVPYENDISKINYVKYTTRPDLTKREAFELLDQRRRQEGYGECENVPSFDPEQYGLGSFDT
ncbi:MAG: hypothetical protein ABEJ72_05320 [Candidatus Aenigmatarchaeota archaeon]